MHKKTIANKLRAECAEYYSAANILMSVGKEDSAPCLFLFRHALELALKTAIIELHVNSDIKSLDFELENEFSSKVKFNKTHSIKILLSAFFLSEYNTLIHTETVIKEKLKKAAQIIDDIDFSSDFFRYPYGKTLSIKGNSRKIFSAGSVIADEIKPHGHNYVVISNGVVQDCKVNRRLKIAMDAVSEITDFIFLK